MSDYIRKVIGPLTPNSTSLGYSVHGFPLNAFALIVCSSLKYSKYQTVEEIFCYSDGHVASTH